MFVINFLIWVLGFVATALGIWANVDNQVPLSLLDRLPIVPALLLLVVGLISFSVGFIGWLGALRENSCLIRTFCIVSSVLFVGEIVSGVLMFILMDQIKAMIASYLNTAVTTYQEDEIVQEFLDYIQQKLECCGGTGYQDWERNVIFSCSSSSTLLRCSVPSSCCTQSTGIHCGLQARLRQGGMAAGGIHTNGCTDLIFEAFKTRLFHVCILTFSVGVCEVVCVVMAVVLLHDISSLQQLTPATLSLPNLERTIDCVQFFPTVTGL